MSAKRVFSLRLNEEVRERLVEAADKQSTTVTSLINRYILQGLSQDQAIISNVSDQGQDSRVTHPDNASISVAEERIEELLFQVLLNQRHLISITQKNNDCLTEASSKLNNMKP